jgi:hypothetical protein
MTLAKVKSADPLVKHFENQDRKYMSPVHWSGPQILHFKDVYPVLYGIC